MTNDHESSLVIDTAVAGGVITMPLWAVSLNEWLHFIMTIMGFFLILYRLYVLAADIKKSNMKPD
jgi:hypothetical protein